MAAPFRRALGGMGGLGGMSGPSGDYEPDSGDYSFRSTSNARVREMEYREELHARRRMVETYEAQIAELSQRVNVLKMDTSTRLQRKEKQVKKCARDAVTLAHSKLVNSSQILKASSEIKDRIKNDTLAELERIGGGSFGDIYQSTQPEFCAKIFKNEIGGFQHPPVSTLILQPLAYIKENKTSGIIYQRYKCSLDVLLKNKVADDTKRILAGHLDAIMLELATLHWAHGDIKPANILVDGDSRLILGDSDEMCQTSIMNPHYSMTRKYHPIYFGADPGERKEVDLWSIGIILYEILSGEQVSSGTTHAEVSKVLAERACLVSKSPEARKEYVTKLLVGTTGPNF